MEKHAVSKLVGAPPGYVGYDEGGELTKAVRQKPLLRRALRRDREGPPRPLQHPAPDPRRRAASPTAQGRTVDFRNTVIIMTSQRGRARDRARPTPLGFSAERARRRPRRPGDPPEPRHVRGEEAVHVPSSSNRVDEIVVFQRADRRAASLAIVDLLMVADLRERLVARGMSTSTLTATARKAFIAKEGTDASATARARCAARSRRLVEDPLSEEILEGKWSTGSISRRGRGGRRARVHPGLGRCPGAAEARQHRAGRRALADELRPGPRRRARRRVDVGRRGGLALP